MATFERVIPLLTYQDIGAAHDFLVRAFGFASGGVHRTPEGQAVHGEVRAGSATIFLHAAAAEHRLESPLAAEVGDSGLLVQVDDADPHFQPARASGARIDSEPVDQPYGQREYGARDLEGHRWWFSAPVNTRRETSLLLPDLRRDLRRRIVGAVPAHRQVVNRAGPIPEGWLDGGRRQVLRPGERILPH